MRHLFPYSRVLACMLEHHNVVPGRQWGLGLPRCVFFFNFSWGATRGEEGRGTGHVVVSKVIENAGRRYKCDGYYLTPVRGIIW